MNFHASEVPIHFPCRIIVHYLICFRQVPRCRISTPAMPMQTWPRRAPPAGTAAAKKRSTTATPTSARDVAAAGATCWDGDDSERWDDDVATTANNSDDSERWPTSCRAVLYACCKRGELKQTKDLKRNSACHRSDRTA